MAGIGSSRTPVTEYEGNSRSKEEAEDVARAFQASFFGSPSLSDVTIKFGSRSIKAHKAILAQRSAYFRKMFCGDFQEAKTDEIELYDDNEMAIEVLLKHLYGFDYCWPKYYNDAQPGVSELKEIMWQGMEEIGSMRDSILAVEDLGTAVKILWPIDAARSWPMIVKVSVCMLGPFYMSKNPEPTGIEEKVNILKTLGDLDVGIDVDRFSEDMDVLARHLRAQEEIESQDERFGRRAWRD